MTRHTHRRPAKPAPSPDTAFPPGELSLRRELAALLTLWSACQRPACQRARQCRGPTVACFEEQHDIVRDLAWEWMVEVGRLLELSHDDMLEIADQVDWQPEEPDTDVDGDWRPDA